MARKPPPSPKRSSQTENLADEVRRVTAFLDGQGAKYAVIGGVAVSVRAEPRFTADLDLAIAEPLEERAEALVLAMQRSGYRTFSVLEDKRDGRLATVRFLGKGDLLIDLLFRFTGIEPEIVDRASAARVLGGPRLPVASLAHLLAMKVQAGRPKDLVDIDSLLAFAKPSDHRVAINALRRMVKLGNDEGRDLVAEARRLFRQKPRTPKNLRARKR